LHLSDEYENATALKKDVGKGRMEEGTNGRTKEKGTAGWGCKEGACRPPTPLPPLFLNAISFNGKRV